MRALLVLSLFLTACALGGGGSAAPAALDISVAVTPPIAGANDATLTASVRSAQTASVTYGWTWSGSGPAAPLIVSPLSATTRVLLPCVGTYGLQVTVIDAAGQSITRPVMIAVGTAGSIAVVTRVEDGGVASAGAQASLEWLPGAGVISTTACDATGSATFAGLVGPVESFRVRVAGGP